MTRTFSSGLAAVAISVAAASLVHAQTAEEVRQKLEAAGKLPSPREVVAKINGDPIYAQEINQAIVAQSAQGVQDPMAVMQARALEQAINRRLFGLRIEQDKITVSDSDVEAYIRNMRRQIESRGGSFEQLLQQQGMTEEQLREQARGQVVLIKFVDRHLPEAELHKYFDEHKRLFDGSEVRVSHILLRDGQNQSFLVQEKLKQDAAALRDEIESGKIDFEAAVKQHSAGPSRSRGGDLGFIPRVGLIDPRFADAAFKLEVDELSEPVQSGSGAHLIKVTDIRPGSKPFSEAREEVKLAATADLQNRMIEEIRESANIEYTGAIPYVHRKSGQLVMPGQSPPEDQPEESTATDSAASPGSSDAAASGQPTSPPTREAVAPSGSPTAPSTDKPATEKPPSPTPSPRLPTVP